MDEKNIKNKSTTKLLHNNKIIQNLSKKSKTKIYKKKEKKNSPLIKNCRKHIKYIIKREDTSYDTNSNNQHINNILSLLNSMKSANIKKTKNKNYSHICSSLSNANLSKTDIKIGTKENSNNMHRKGKSMIFNKAMTNLKNELPLEKENRELKRKILLLQQKNYLLLKKNQRYKHLQIQIRNQNANNSLISNKYSSHLIDSDTNFDASCNYYVTTTGSNKGIKPKDEFFSIKKYKQPCVNSNTCNNSSIKNIIYQNKSRILTKKFSYKPNLNRNRNKSINGNKFINIINNFSKNYSYLTIDSPNLVLNSGLSKRSGLYNLKNINIYGKKKENYQIAKTEVKKQFKNMIMNSISNNEDKNSCLTENNIDINMKKGNLTTRNNIKKHHSKNQNIIVGTNKNIGCLININKKRDGNKQSLEVENKKIEGHKYSSSQALFDSMNEIMERAKNLLTSYNDLSKHLSDKNNKKDK